MKPARLLTLCLPALLLGIGAGQPARADFELNDAQGRRVLLKDDGTWRYLDPEARPALTPAAEAPAKPTAVAELRLMGRTELSAGCSFTLALSNALPHEIRSLVPEFAVLRSSGVVYTTQGLGFGPVKPGDSYQRDLRILGIACQDIAKLQVQGGDRCDMGDLNKFSDAKGECLARLKVLPSALISFEK
jgi:hypothetical protein